MTNAQTVELAVAAALSYVVIASIIYYAVDELTTFTEETKLTISVFWAALPPIVPFTAFIFVMTYIVQVGRLPWLLRDWWRRRRTKIALPTAQVVKDNER